MREPFIRRQNRPIIFSAPMVQALLAGRKSQTRRILKPPYGTLEYSGGMWTPICTKFFPGDRLYVREAWRAAPAYDDLAPSAMGGEEPIRYEADGVWEAWGWTMPNGPGGRLRPSIHMPRWASRLTLAVTDVRVQRLQDISEADARAEGVSDEWADTELYFQTNPYRYGFSALWNSIHGPDAWGANPWVVAVSFDVIRGNIDA